LRKDEENKKRKTTTDNGRGYCQQANGNVAKRRAVTAATIALTRAVITRPKRRNDISAGFRVATDFEK